MNHTELKQENCDLNERLSSLNEKYKCLQEEFMKLKNEYSENMIVQSMNEMKIRYDTMMRTMVPSYKYKVLNEKCDMFVRNFSGCSVLIDHIIKLMRSIESDFPYLSTDVKNIILKAELELITTKEILEDCVCTK